VNILRQILATWRRQKVALDSAKAYHAEERARIDRLVLAGNGREGLRENLALLGIDVDKAERPRLATLGGIRL